MLNLSELTDKVRALAIEAGDFIREERKKFHREAIEKKHAHDYVSYVDKESEKKIVTRLKELLPEAGFIAEEGSGTLNDEQYCWLVDPLDGTTNYSQGLPIFPVSIGLQCKGETVLGVVYAPYLNELYEACKGKGAMLNGRSIHVSGKNDTQESVVSTGFPIDKDRNPDNNLDNLARILPMVRGVRRQGSAAFDLCCVAAGILDGYWEFNLHLWDVCAGILIVTEAGGTVRSFREDRNVSIVAGTPAIVEQLYPRLSDKPGKICL